MKERGAIKYDMKILKDSKKLKTKKPKMYIFYFSTFFFV